jgi:hypothetical protein
LPALPEDAVVGRGYRTGLEQGIFVTDEGMSIKVTVGIRLVVTHVAKNLAAINPTLRPDVWKGKVAAGHRVADKQVRLQSDIFCTNTILKPNQIIAKHLDIHMEYIMSTTYESAMRSESIILQTDYQI